MNIFCTIFTPTYNRKYTLPRLYESIKKQTIKDFEWIIIDDGSTDGTEQLVESWLKEKNDFKINYEKVTNNGKHRAINKAVKLAKGKMFFIVDSDDYLTEDAIEKIKYYENTLPKKDKALYAGVAGFRGYTINDSIGKMIQEEYIDALNTERKRFGLLGDKAEAYYTKILKKYPFPEFNNEKFIPESVVWNKISADGYKIRWFNQIIYICNYLEDGLTKNTLKLYRENHKGYLLFIKSEIENTNPDLKRKIKYYYGYYIAVKDSKADEDIMKDLKINIITLQLIKIIHFIKNKQRK